uniref:Reverse transcriptase domain-containing protein n=1 Tax=Spongospora subterranea TaxID=70186 RepID=A0A0H5QU59_9EUKA|eukprot:CRZ05425.1 hypothetical protein [Spongospora subterranea]
MEKGQPKRGSRTNSCEVRKIYNESDLNHNEQVQNEHDLLIENLWRERLSQPPERITIREQERALTKANSKSTGGIDGIPNSLIKQLCKNDTIKCALLRAINADVIV